MNLPAFYSATGIGVWNLDAFLEKGEVSPIFTDRLGLPVHVLQDFVDGDVQPGVLPLFGDVPIHQAQEVRDAIGRQGAIGFILAKCLER